MMMTGPLLAWIQNWQFNLESYNLFTKVTFTCFTIITGHGGLLKISVNHRELVSKATGITGVNELIAGNLIELFYD